MGRANFIRRINSHLQKLQICGVRGGNGFGNYDLAGEKKTNTDYSCDETKKNDEPTFHNQVSGSQISSRQFRGPKTNYFVVYI